MDITGKQGSQLPFPGGNQTHRIKHECVDSFKRERENFRKMKSDLETDPEYQGKFVAVVDNKVVAVNNDRRELDIEMSQQYKNGTFFIGKVYEKKI